MVLWINCIVCMYFFRNNKQNFLTRQYAMATVVVFVVAEDNVTVLKWCFSKYIEWHLPESRKKPNLQSFPFFSILFLCEYFSLYVCPWLLYFGLFISWDLQKKLNTHTTHNGSTTHSQLIMLIVKALKISLQQIPNTKVRLFQRTPTTHQNQAPVIIESSIKERILGCQQSMCGQ